MTHDLQASTITMTSANGDDVEAYLAVPTDVTRCGSIVVIHHLPGYDEATKEIVRKFAANGIAALMPNLYWRIAPGASSDDAAAAARSAGGVSDEQMVDDVAGAMAYLKGLATSNGKVAVIGYCSGGRQAFVAGCRLPLDATIDCYGGFVVTDPPAEHPLRVRAVVSEAPGLSGPLLGLFGADDTHPSPEENARLGEALTGANKTFTFRTFEDAGHAFFGVDRPGYRVQAATEGWIEVLRFLGETVA